MKNEKSLIKKKRFLFFANKSVGGISMKREAIPSNNNFILALNRMPTKLLGRETIHTCVFAQHELKLMELFLTGLK